MKTQFKLITLLTIVCIYTSSCTQEKPIPPSGISNEILSKIKALGYSTSNVKMFNDGYIVEGDILLTRKDLDSKSDITTLRLAETEQYRTNNLITVPTHARRTISVSISGLSSYYTDALDTAILRYNNLNLGLNFERVSSGGEIQVSGYYETGGYLAWAGFPSGGNPYDTVKVNTVYYSPTTVWYLASVIQHEIGHCIGLRHTDYMDKSYSCPYNGNESGHPAGEVHIPGTPSTPDAGSFMLACVPYSSFTFNSNDITALRHLYPAPPVPPNLPGVTYLGYALNGPRIYFFYGNGTNVTAGVIVDPYKQFTVTHFINGKITSTGLTGRMYATDEDNFQYTFVLSGMDFQRVLID